MGIDYLSLGLSGLAAAISLQRVGHKVTVLERDADIPKVVSAHQNVRLVTDNSTLTRSADSAEDVVSRQT